MFEQEALKRNSGWFVESQMAQLRKIEIDFLRVQPVHRINQIVNDALFCLPAEILDKHMSSEVL